MALQRGNSSLQSSGSYGRQPAAAAAVAAVDNVGDETVVDSSAGGFGSRVWVDDVDLVFSILDSEEETFAQVWH